MRQIPIKKNRKNYGIIGAGKLARHLMHYFDLETIDYRTWCRAYNTHQQLIEMFLCSDVILLAIKDDAIEEFIVDNHFLLEKPLIHFSGCVNTQYALGFHPLISFGETLYELDLYRSIPFVTNIDISKFIIMFPQLSNSCYYIPTEDKPYYHALCVMSGNFSTILWNKIFTELSDKFDLPKEIARPYLESICLNLLHDHNSALTGPIVRGDTKTITKHQEVLEHDDFLTIYNSFVQLFEKQNVS